MADYSSTSSLTRSERLRRVKVSYRLPLAGRRPRFVPQLVAIDLDDLKQLGVLRHLTHEGAHQPIPDAAPHAFTSKTQNHHLPSRVVASRSIYMAYVFGPAFPR